MVGDVFSEFPGAKLVKSKNPLAWGPVTWHTLHTMAENYPVEPDDHHQTGCHNFLSGLPYMLPCSKCGYHLWEYEEEARLHDFADVCKNRANLRKYFVDAHNQVNANVEIPKPQWTVEQAQTKYSQTNIVMFEPEKWDAIRGHIKKW